MKSLKKTLVLLVVLSMILSAVSPVFAFNDVEDQHYAEQANKMAAFGVFVGDNGNFNGDVEITRAEMAVIIGKLTGMTEAQAKENQAYASKFSDVKADEWYTGWINLVAGRGIISGFPDGRFGPTEKVTQAQAVTMIVKALGWGVVVDNQSGTWPANYIAKAAELQLFKNVESKDELVTRGNVAIYCYNALTAKTWDVISSEDNKLTSGASRTETILSKYFSEFVNDEGEMKLVEGALVTATPITDTTLGTSQIKLTGGTIDSEADDVASFLEVKETVKKPEEKTYGVGNNITAYVLGTASENIAALYGKTVDVIYGKDNKVAYIAVTDDAMDGIVTAWDEEEIEIDGEAYEFADDYTVNVFATEVEDTITDIFTALEVTDAERKFDRVVKANVVLDEDGDIKSINFIFAGEYTSDDVTVAEYVVEDISSKGKVSVVNGTSNVFGKEFEDLEDEVRVIKNNEIVDLEDIEIGDVLTVVEAGDDKTIYVSSARAEGEITGLKNNSTYTLDSSDVYYTAKGIIASSNGDIEDAEDVADDTNTLKSYFGEEVELYLNFMGEVAAVVANAESVDATLGIVTRDATERYDEDKEVYYYQVKILTEEGTSTYKVYNEEDEEDWDTGDDAAEFSALVAGDIVIFSADSNRVIETTDITLVDDEDEVTIGSTEVEVVDMSDIDAISDSKKKVTIGEDDDAVDYKFAGATLYNNAEEDIEVIKGWATICNDDVEDDVTIFEGYAGKAFVKKTESTSKTVLFYVAALDPETDYVTNDAEYAVLVDVEYTVEDDEDVYTATLYVDGKEVTYEIDEDVADVAEAGDFISYEVSDDKIVVVTKLVDVYAFTKLESEEEVDNQVTGVTLTHKALLEVENVYDTYVEFVTEYNCGESDCEHGSAADLDIDEDGYVIYDLRDGYKMFDGDLEDLEGEYAYGFAAEGEEGCDVFVVLD